MAWSVTVWLVSGAVALMLTAIALWVQPEVLENVVDGREFFAKIVAASIAVWLWYLFAINAGNVVTFTNTGTEVPQNYGSLGYLAIAPVGVVLLEMGATFLSYMDMDNARLEF